MSARTHVVARVRRELARTERDHSCHVFPLPPDAAPSPDAALPAEAPLSAEAAPAADAPPAVDAPPPAGESSGTSGSSQDVLEAYCGYTIAPGEAEVLNEPDGLPCTACLLRSLIQS